MDPSRKALHFIGSSKKDLRGMPDEVRDVFGSALLDAQFGDVPDGARAFGEGLGHDVMKLVEDFDGDTYRAAYTVAFARAVYVLHVFQEEVEVRDRHTGPGQESDSGAATGGSRALPPDVQPFGEA